MPVFGFFNCFNPKFFQVQIIVAPKEDRTVLCHHFGELGFYQLSCCFPKLGPSQIGGIPNSWMVYRLNGHLHDCLIGDFNRTPTSFLPGTLWFFDVICSNSYGIYPPIGSRFHSNFPSYPLAMDLPYPWHPFIPRKPCPISAPWSWASCDPSRSPRPCASLDSCTATPLGSWG